MKDGIHPEYKPAHIHCACGSVIETHSTKGNYEIQICAKCHPFFTGKQKFVDTAGRVERFQRRYAKVTAAKAAAAAAADAAAADAPAPAPSVPPAASPAAASDSAPAQPAPAAGNPPESARS